MLLSKVKQFFQETVFGKSGYQLNEDTAQLIIDHSEVIEQDGAVLIVAITDHLYFKGKKVAAEYMWWVPPEKRNTSLGYRMFKKYEQWAKDNNADVIMMDCLDDKVARFYESQGYKLVQRTYMKELT